MKMLKNSDKGRKKMEDLLEEYVNQATLRLLFRQVKDDDITLTKAARYADMSEDAFQAAMQEYEASQKS